MKDDVLALLSSPSPVSNQNSNQQKSFQPSNNLLAPSLSSFSSEIYFQEQQQQKSQNPNSSSSFGDFDSKIRELEEQARRFKIQDGELALNNNQQSQPIGKYKAVCFSNNESSNENNESSRDQQSSSNRLNTSLGLQVQTKCYTPNSFRLGDIKNEENYLDQIR